MKIARREYPKLESMWTFYSENARRFKVEDYLSTFSKVELEQLEIYTWAATLFTPKEITNVAIAYDIHTIVEEMLGGAIGEGFKVIAQ